MRNMPSRRITIGLAALVAVLLVFAVYNWFSDTPAITVSLPPTVQGGGIQMPTDVGDAAIEVGQVTPWDTERAVFEFRDEQTKKLNRVFGFEKLLNPRDQSTKRRLQNPYMKIFEDNFRCRITADLGSVVGEKIQGKYSPQNADLSGNVRIYIRSTDPTDPVAATIHLDELTYSSERSEFATDGPVKIFSTEAEMSGTGMVMIYNAQLARIELLKITDLDYIRLRNAIKDDDPSGTDSDTTSGTLAGTPSGTLAGTPSDTSAVPSSDTLPTGSAVVAQEQSRPATSSTEPESPQPRPDGYYECYLDKDVVIKYGNQIHVAGKRIVYISNLLWADRTSKEGALAENVSEQGDGAPGPDRQSSASSATVEAPAQPAAQPDLVNDNTFAQMADLSDFVNDDTKDIVITCNGGVIIQPMGQAVPLFDSGSNPYRRQASQTAQPTADGKVTNAAHTSAASSLQTTNNSTPGTPGPESAQSQQAGADKPADFRAERIDYNVETGNAFAHGPIEFTLYLDPNDPADEPVPVVITAVKNAEFVRDENKFTFNGNVVGTHEVHDNALTNHNTFYSKRMIVEMQSSSQDVPRTGISQVTLVGGNVKLESKRFDGRRLLSYVRLSCVKVEYSAISEIIRAVGPGLIEMNNENVPPSPEDSSDKFNLQGPCYAIMEGFDQLQWDTLTGTVIAQAGDDSINVAYQPIVDGQLGNRIWAATQHCRASFVPVAGGRTRLETMQATGGVYYQEEEGNVFLGDSLDYNTIVSLMTINGLPNDPCFLNGTLVQGIEYDLATGRVKGQLSSSPGAITLSDQL